MVIAIGMGQGAAAKAPDMIRAEGCGSCVALALYDPKTKVGGMAHIMLPSSGVRGTALKGDEAYQYADTAVPALLEEMQKKGASRSDIIARMAGGAAMFPSYSATSAGIGQYNVEAVRAALKKEGILLANCDIHGRHGRNVELHMDSGRVVVTAFVKTDREI